MESSGLTMIDCPHFVWYPYGGFLKWWYPQIIHFNRVFHYKPSILGYPSFWKHPYEPKYAVFDRRSKRLSFSRWINTTQLGGWTCFWSLKTSTWPFCHKSQGTTMVHLEKSVADVFFWVLNSYFIQFWMLDAGEWKAAHSWEVRARSWEDVTSRLVLPVDFVL